jgi:hypothetical protein
MKKSIINIEMNRTVGGNISTRNNTNGVKFDNGEMFLCSQHHVAEKSHGKPNELFKRERERMKFLIKNLFSRENLSIGGMRYKLPDDNPQEQGITIAPLNMEVGIPICRSKK